MCVIFFRMAFTASISIVLWFLVVLSSDIIKAKTVTNSSLGSVEKQHDKQRCSVYFFDELKCNVSVMDNNTDFSIYPSWFYRLDIWCDTVMPSSLMDGLFEPLADSLFHISIHNCYIVSISRNAFRGMKTLLTLWIGGGNNSKMNGCGVELSNVSTMIQPPQPGLEVIKLFSCSTQLSMEFFLLINVKMPTTVGILTFMSVKNSILGVSEPVKCRIS